MNSNLFSVIKGSSSSCILRVIESLSGDPYNITNKTITGTVSGCPDIALVPGDFEIIDAVIGKFRLNLSAINTALFEVGIQSIQVKFVDNTDPLDIKKVNFDNILQVGE